MKAWVHPCRKHPALRYGEHIISSNTVMAVVPDSNRISFSSTQLTTFQTVSYQIFGCFYYTIYNIAVQGDKLYKFVFFTTARSIARQWTLYPPCGIAIILEIIYNKWQKAIIDHYRKGKAAMPKRKYGFNTVYISERLQESLRPISHCALSTIIAPMGYGKTTAADWYLEKKEDDGATVIRISVYSDNLAVFWRSVQEAFFHAGIDLLRDYPCPVDAVGGSMLIDDLCHVLGSERECCIFIDDFHLLTDSRAAHFICRLAQRLPQNVHIIIASRDRFLPAAETVRLGSRLYQIGVEQLRLNYTELAVYARRCGTPLTDTQTEELLYFSEGWFSAVYLNLKTLSEQGALPDRSSDIYALFTAAMLDPLHEETREFLAVMGLTDEFTVEMARTVSGRADAETLLTSLTEQNAFVTKLPDGKSFRFHHMMKECAERTFLTLPAGRQAEYLDRLGEWYETHRLYVHALNAYRRCGNYDALLRTVGEDAGILLTSLQPDKVLDIIDSCPHDELTAHPTALLVLMRCMFNLGRIPKMLELRGLLTAAADVPRLPQQTRDNILGECDLIMSFLKYNDIAAMSDLHRSASRLMSRPAVSISNSGGWTFGSPSVLMMFHRAPGGLQDELAAMDECMPHYYKITNDHGRGAELIMRAEAEFMHGHLADAQIALERAYTQTEESGQMNMTLCCDFLAMRIAQLTDHAPHRSESDRREQLLTHHNSAWINILNAACAYRSALSGDTDSIPEVFASHMLGSVSILAPGRPMHDMIENQVYLVQGEYAKIIGRSEQQLSVCGRLHYGLVSLHLLIQTAAANERLGRYDEACRLIGLAAAEAMPDGLIMPFVENYTYIGGLLRDAVIGYAEPLNESANHPDKSAVHPSITHECACSLSRAADFLREVERLGTEYVDRRTRYRISYAEPAEFAALTEREREVARLMVQRLGNSEIAERLYLSVGSVKQYTSGIYSKLQIDGDTRTKRRRLIKLVGKQDTDK